MDRKDFFKKTCQLGMCSCAGLMFFSENNILASTSDDEPKEDWRIGFMQKRFAQFIDIIDKNTDVETRDKIIEELGRFCSKENEAQFSEYIGNVDKFLEYTQSKWVEKAEFNKEQNVILVTDKKRDSCFCPLVKDKFMSKDFCNCSKGWQKQTFEMLLGKAVEVEILSSILRGSDRCSFKISIV
jgi:hypothetical protein